MNADFNPLRAKLQKRSAILTLPYMTTDIFALLAEHNIQYERVDHPPVYTCEQAEELVPSMRGVHTKNLFVRDKKGHHHFLVVVSQSKSVDLKALSSKLGVSKSSLGSSHRLQNYLGIEPGSVSLLAIANDTESAVEVVLDRDVWQEDALQCHPLVNTTTLAIARSDIERLFGITGHRWRVLYIPQITR